MNPDSFQLSDLRRSPDVEAANLFAWDASDGYLLEAVAQYLPDLAEPADQLVLLNDSYGALSFGMAARFGVKGIRVQQDLCTGEQALRENGERLGIELGARQRSLLVDGGAALLSGARLVLLKLPRGLAELEQTVQAIARHADPGAVLLAAGRVKHMSLAMNAVLARYFGTVRASLAQQKSRLLTATDPALPTDAVGFPLSATVQAAPGLELEVRAHGAVFAGAALDIGTRFLLDSLTEPRLPQVGTVIDLGCGTGLLATRAALLRPESKVIATDRSEAAIRSAAATAAANGARNVTVLQDDAGQSLPAGCADFILLNPPFHSGAAVHTGVALKLFAAAARLLAPGGRLWTVYNRHLDYRPALQRTIGPSRAIAQGPKFTVLESTRR
ncbi:MAG: methyltransferase [Renibacterium salmoninarum]|nr:methyltransferase [Renibacterium salmoninarum]